MLYNRTSQEFFWDVRGPLYKVREPERGFGFGEDSDSEKILPGEDSDSEKISYPITPARETEPDRLSDRAGFLIGFSAREWYDADDG